MLNFKKFSLGLYKLNVRFFTTYVRGAQSLPIGENRKMIENESQIFADWIVNKINSEIKPKFSIYDLPNELRLKFENTYKINSLSIKNEIKYDNINDPRCKEINEIYDSLGSIDRETLTYILEKHPNEFKEKHLYNDVLDGLNHIKMFCRYGDIIKMQISLNLDFKREDHIIPGSIVKLPHDSNLVKDFCVITSDENNELAFECGAKTVMSAAKFASSLEEKTFNNRKIIATDDQYYDLFEYCKDGIEKLGLNLPSREEGTLIKNEDLKQVLLFLATNHVNLKIMKRKSDFIKASDYFNKIVQLEIGDTLMSNQQLMENIDFVFQFFSERQPLTVAGRYFLTAVLIVRNKTFAINSLTIDPKLPGYKHVTSLEKNKF